MHFFSRSSNNSAKTNLANNGGVQFAIFQGQILTVGIHIHHWHIPSRPMFGFAASFKMLPANYFFLIEEWLVMYKCCLYFFPLELIPVTAGGGLFFRILRCSHSRFRTYRLKKAKVGIIKQVGSGLCRGTQTCAYASVFFSAVPSLI